MRKLPAAYMPVVAAFMLTGIMTLIVAGVSTLVAIGPAPGFVGRWLGAWVTSWAVAFPVMTLVQPHVRRLAARIVAAPEA